MAEQSRESVTGGVLVVYQATTAGRAALHTAWLLARQRAAPLHVLVIVPLAREGVGCGRQRQGVALWNRELRRTAQDELEQAARLLEPAGQRAFEIAHGPVLASIVRVATRARVTEIVVAHRRVSRLPLLGRDHRLQRAGPWTVHVAPRGKAEMVP